MSLLLLEENSCKKLLDKVNGPVKSIIDNYASKCKNSTTGLIDGKTIDKKFCKPDLCSLTLEVFNLLISIRNEVNLLDSLKKDIKTIHKNHEANMDKLFQKFTEKIATESKK